MRPPLLYVPPPAMPPGIASRVPAIARALDAYRRLFEVTVFNWPEYSERLGQPPEALVDTLARSTDPDTFVVAEAPAVTPLLVAMDQGKAHPRAVVAIGIPSTDATLRSLGLVSVVDAARSLTERRGRAREFLTFLARVLGDEEAVRGVQDAMDWDVVFAFDDWVDQIDLLSLGPFPETPALNFQSAMFPLLAEGEIERVFKRIFPLGRMASLENYPARLDVASSADELIAQVMPFLESLAGRRE